MGTTRDRDALQIKLGERVAVALHLQRNDCVDVLCYLILAPNGSEYPGEPKEELRECLFHVALWLVTDTAARDDLIAWNTEAAPHMDPLESVRRWAGSRGPIFF